MIRNSALIICLLCFNNIIAQEVSIYEVVANDIVTNNVIRHKLKKEVTKKVKQYYINDSLKFIVDNELHGYGHVVCPLLRDSLRNYQNVISTNIDTLLKSYHNLRIKQPNSNKYISDLSTDSLSQVRVYFSKPIFNTLVCEISFTKDEYVGYKSTPKILTSLLLFYIFDEQNQKVIKLICTEFERNIEFRYLPSF